jgi:hypothetical protein
MNELQEVGTVCFDFLDVCRNKLKRALLFLGFNLYECQSLAIG